LNSSNEVLAANTPLGYFGELLLPLSGNNYAT
jgi:hypothetical protein